MGQVVYNRSSTSHRACTASAHTLMWNTSRCPCSVAFFLLPKRVIFRRMSTSMLLPPASCRFVGVMVYRSELPARIVASRGVLSGLVMVTTCLYACGQTCWQQCERRAYVEECCDHRDVYNLPELYAHKKQLFRMKLQHGECGTQDAGQSSTDGMEQQQQRHPLHAPHVYHHLQSVS